MKVIHKYLVIALLLSLIFSVSAVAAQKDMTFEQSDINDVGKTNWLQVKVVFQMFNLKSMEP